MARKKENSKNTSAVGEPSCVQPSAGVTVDPTVKPDEEVIPKPKKKNRNRPRKKSMNLQEQRKAFYDKSVKSVEEKYKQVTEGNIDHEEMKKTLYQLIDEINSQIELQQKKALEEQASTENDEKTKLQRTIGGGDEWSQVKSRQPQKESVKKWVEDVRGLLTKLEDLQRKLERDSARNQTRARNEEQQQMILNKLIKMKQSKDPSLKITATSLMTQNIEISPDLMKILYYPILLTRKVEKEFCVILEKKNQTTLTVKAATADDLAAVLTHLRELDPNTSSNVIERYTLEKAAGGVVIGRQGATVRLIETTHNVSVMTESSNNSTIVLIILGKYENVQKTKSHIDKLLEENRSATSLETFTMPFYALKILLNTNRGDSALVRRLEIDTNSAIKVNNATDPTLCQIQIRGSADNVATAKSKMENAIATYGTRTVPLSTDKQTKLFNTNTRRISDKVAPNEDQRTSCLRELKNLREKALLVQQPEGVVVVGEQGQVEGFAKELENFLKNWASVPEDVTETIPVKEHAIAPLIEKRGLKMREVEDQFNVSVSLEKSSKTIRFKGTTREAVDKAIAAIKKIVDDIKPIVTEEYSIDKKYVGNVIGTKGATAVQLRNDTKISNIQVIPVNSEKSLLRLKGHADAINQAKLLIDDIVVKAKAAEATKSAVPAAIEAPIKVEEKKKQPTQRKQLQPDVESNITFPALAESVKKSNAGSANPCQDIEPNENKDAEKENDTFGNNEIKQVIDPMAEVAG